MAVPSLLTQCYDQVNNHPCRVLSLRTGLGIAVTIGQLSPVLC